MAIDLASTLSPYEFKNMLPLDVLAAVASETLRNEITSTSNTKSNVTHNSKKQIKKSSTVMTFEEIKALPTRSLIDKFSELTSDELTKKYSYKCLLMPHRCTMSFKSFGNENKACDKMKSHLLFHMQQISLENEINKNISSMVFFPKSTKSCGKHEGKMCKKSLKKQQIMLSPLKQAQAVPTKTSSHKFGKIQKSTFCVQKMKNYQKYKRNSVHKSFKSKTCKVYSSYLREKAFLKGSAKERLKCMPEIPNSTISSTDVMPNYSKGDCNKSGYNNYSKHLSCIFLPDVKDENNEPLDVYDQVLVPNDTDTAENPKKSSFLQDHNYAIFDETKLVTSDVKILSRKNSSCFSFRPTIKPQLIIRTPPFPFVHTPLLPEVAEIKEIDKEEQSDKYEYLDFIKIIDDGGVINAEDETDSQLVDKYTDNLFYKLSSNSVLECVENLVSIKHSNGCLPKGQVPANENDENLENMQRFEKELALEYIAKLHAKKRKRIPDSLFCQICPDKHFTAQATLIHHYRSHAGIKPYTCNICSATFTRQHSLNYHMLIHQNLSRFTCEFCGRTFRHPSHYKEHLRRHTGETPYHCTDCNLHFKTRNTFKRHLKTRHGKLLTATGIEDIALEEYCPKTKS